MPGRGGEKGRPVYCRTVRSTPGAARWAPVASLLPGRGNQKGSGAASAPWEAHPPAPLPENFFLPASHFRGASLISSLETQRSVLVTAESQVPSEAPGTW